MEIASPRLVAESAAPAAAAAGTPGAALDPPRARAVPGFRQFNLLSSLSNLELTNALFSFARSRDNAIDALYRLNAARINLARALGEMERIS